MIVLCICTKFNENNSKGFKVIERKQFVTDRQMDIQTHRQLWGKTICIPQMMHMAKLFFACFRYERYSRINMFAQGTCVF